MCEGFIIRAWLQALKRRRNCGKKRPKDHKSFLTNKGPELPSHPFMQSMKEQNVGVLLVVAVPVFLPATSLANSPFCRQDESYSGIFGLNVPEEAGFRV